MSFELGGHRHCDEYIDDATAPPAVRKYLARARRPAHGHMVSEPWPKLFATFDGEDWKGIAKGDRVRVVMASRMGDVGITKDLAVSNGYDVRCFVDQLSNFGEVA